MRKKIFTFLLALVTSVGLSWAVPTEFANCYDCWRSPEYPNISGQCHLFNFGNPGVGNGNPSGPWKLEFVEYYNSSSTEYDDIVSSYAASQYGKSPEQMEVYRLYQWQNGAYQPVAYGVLYAYANESNPVEHAAFFEANGYWGCYFTDNTHSSGDDFNITFNEDASTGFADLHGGSTPAVDPTPTPSGDGDKLAGAFSVSGTKVVYFSKGNLQATTNDLGATWTWGFAENQWDYVGDNAANTSFEYWGETGNGSYDLFGWIGESSTLDDYRKYGIGSNYDFTDCGNTAGEDLKADWGSLMGSDWRTLTYDEWQYLIKSRNNAANLLAYATVNGKTGLILLPDSWASSSVALTITTANYTTNIISASDWSTLEEQGCVFLPAAGSREDASVSGVGVGGDYWSSSSPSGKQYDEGNAYCFFFDTDFSKQADGMHFNKRGRGYGLSVRLVSETAPGGSTPEPTPAESVTVVFEANNNQKEVEVTLPHTFACDFQNGNGELDGIIQELYALQYGGYCQAFTVPTSTGNAAVTASKDGNNHYIAISEAFEGTATVTGNYIKYLDTEQMGNTSVDYTLTISVQGSTPTPSGDLHVTELEPPASWSGKSTYLAVADHMPGFEETDAELAKTWEAPTNCNSILIYHVAEQYGDDRMYYHYFNAGNFVESEDGWYELGAVYTNATNNGIKTFYTSSGGGSTPEIKLYADFGGDWADTEAFTDNGDGTATLTIPSLEAKHNAIFVKKDGVQMSSGHNFTRENPSADVSGNQLAMWFDTDEAGEYTFTFEYSTNILTITYPTPTPTPAPSDDANKLPGAFSVSGTKVVYFSKGNLRATTADNGATWTWGFAENQWDYVGNNAANNAINGGGTVSTNGAVDLFGWSSTDNNYYGIDNSTDLTDYDGNFQDWGAKVGSDWHALNGAQWEYLLLTREPGSLAGGTSNPRFTRATILTDGTAPSQDIFGLILFPDNFNDGGEYIDGVTWNGINSHSSYVSPTYCTTAGWATLESMGCVFLPAPGWRSGNEVTNVGAFGIYWSSTKYSEEDASCIYFSNTDVAAFHSYITTGASVRLVSETAPSPAPTSFTFPAGTTIYYDFTAYGNGINVYAPGAPTDWYENTANIIPVTLSSDWEISASTNLFKSDASGWNFVTGTILPTDGQNMIVSTNGVDYAWGTHVPAYTVAGEPAVAFGTPTWAPTNTDNDMVKQSNGTYKWEKEDVELAKDAVVSFKVCQDHGWDVAYPNDNFNHTIPADGIYTLTITFDPNAEGDKVAINALKTADVVVAQTAEMKGFGDWNTGIALENINEGAAARVTKNLAAGAHEFKMIINDGWRGKVGATITRANNTVAEIVDNPNGSNITLTADIPGDYIFTWTYAENTLSVEFPSLVVYVQNLIAAIGEVTLESGDAINAARTAYDNLLDADQKQAVSNYGVLEAAEAAYAALAQAAADQLAANTVKGLIDAIDNPVVYTNDCKAKIDAARAAYDALTEAQKTLVGDEYAQKLADAEAAYDAFIVYTVAGEPEALFGSFWNIGDTNNDMVKQSNGTYKWEKSEVALAAGIAKFKIIKDHVTYEYPTSNYELQIEEDGIYTVTIIYNPKAAEDRITTNALKTGEAVIVHTAEMKGSWNNWTDGLELENINEGAAARATKILTPGTYEFKMIIDGSWLGEASTMFTRNENAKAEIGGDEDNLKLNADIPGCYTFTWTYETNTLEIGYPNYIDADFAIDFRTDPYTKVGGGDLPAGVLVEGSMNTGDAQHGYRLPVITIPVTAGNYKVMMGTCTYSNQDATIKTEDNSYTYATLATNNGTCYHQNTATNVVGAIFNVPSDQIIKVYGAEYTPFFSIKKMEAVPAFTDFEISFQSNPYEVISGAKPEGTVIAGSHNDADHGYHNVEATVPMQAGNYRLTLGACGYGNGAGNVISETNVELASFNQKLEDNNKCYHQDPANNIVSMIFTVDIDQTITIDCGEYTPYMKLEKLQDNTYYINFENAEGAIGTVPGEVAIAAGESWTIPANLTLYKEGYTFVGWSDGVNTYAPGDEFFPSAHGTLQAVYTANSVSIADASAINVKWYFGESNGAPSVTWNGVAGYLLAKGEVDGELIDLKLDIDATSGKFHNAGRGDKWAQVNANTVFTFPSKEGAVVNVETYSGNETYDLAAGTLTCNVNDYYSYLEIVYPAPTTAVVIGDPNDADQVNAFLNTYDGQTIDELVIDRPVYNNMYNTLCLPFDMDATQIAASSLNGVEIYEFIDVDVTNDELYLYTSEQKHEIVAGRPYLVKFSAASQLDDLDFVNVTINNANLDNQAVTIKGVTFKGTFQPVVLGAQGGLNFNGGHLFLAANNTLYWPNTNNPLKPFRAYFTVNVDAGQSAGMPVRRGMPAHIGGPAQIVTGVENVQGDNVQGTKVVENGVLYIIKNGVKYNAQGQEVK